MKSGKQGAKGMGHLGGGAVEVENTARMSALRDSVSGLVVIVQCRIMILDKSEPPLAPILPNKENQIENL